MKKSYSTDVYFNKLKELLKDGLITLGPKLIFVSANGDYELFNQYRIHKDTNYWVTRHADEQQFRFNKLRNAVTWCVYNRQGHYIDSNKILDLDRQQASLELEIAHYRGIVERTEDFDQHIIYTTKLREKQYRQKRIQKELDKYITTARLWQTKELKNATKRNERK